MSEDTQRDEEPTAGTADRGEEIPVQVEGATEDRRGGTGAIEQFDETIIDLLSWVLDTETRARIYVYLRQAPWSTSGEVAEGTGLYPSTVREALAALHDEEKVSRRKRENEGAGNNPYEYTAIAPSDLVGGVIGQIQDELNTVFNLDKHLGRGRDGDEIETGPVTINVDEESDDGPMGEASVGDRTDEEATSEDGDENDGEETGENEP